MELQFNERIIEKEIGPLAKEYDMVRGANVNIARISPLMIDGLKPVQRRAIYDMYLDEQGKQFRKLASISGDTFGKFHPHAPTSIDDAVVGITQSWHNTIPLVTGSGNWGTISGDPAGASRYIKAKLSDYTQACFFDDWKDSVVDMVMGHDEKHKEPIYLPAKYPNVLLNGCLGIGYGLSSNFPTYNFKEVIDACIQLMADPDANIVLIPDSPTGCDIIECDFGHICNTGAGKFSMRCKYEIDAENNVIMITNLPYMVYVNNIREKIADIKEKNGLIELIGMNDLTDKEGIKLQLIIRNDINPYKFMKKLIKEVADLEKPYPVTITAANDYECIDYSIKGILNEWITWRREQKRIVMNHRYSRLLTDQRSNDVRLFLLEGDNLEKTIEIFKTSRNRASVEKNLIEAYKNSPIKMDTLQARTLAKMEFIELCDEEHEKCLKERERLNQEIKEVEDILGDPKGTDKMIIAELRDGAKRFGIPRRSNVVPYKISIESEIQGVCILQLSSDGNIVRRIATNVDEEPIPTDYDGFAVKVDNDSSFIIIDENGYHTFIKTKELPIDSEVPVNRYGRNDISGNIVALLPFDIDSDKTCTLISKKGMLKRFKISDMKPSRKPFIQLDSGDKLVRGIVTRIKSQKDLLIYTKEGMGQRLDPNTIRITSPIAKGTYGFKLTGDDEIIGCYSIDPSENQYLLYVTTKGKMRLNNIEYLPIRNSKYDRMVTLISLNDRDKLLSIVGCNKLDKVQVFFNNGEDETIELHQLEESTMSSPAKKVTNQNAVTTSIVKVKLL